MALLHAQSYDIGADLQDAGRYLQGDIALAVGRFDTRRIQRDIVQADLKIRAFRRDHDGVLIADIERNGGIHLLRRQIDAPLPAVDLTGKAELFIGQDISAAAVGAERRGLRRNRPCAFLTRRSRNRRRQRNGWALLLLRRGLNRKGRRGGWLRRRWGRLLGRRLLARYGRRNGGRRYGCRSSLGGPFRRHVEGGGLRHRARRNGPPYQHCQRIPDGFTAGHFTAPTDLASLGAGRSVRTR
ncbi:hypothetical protein D3C78_1183670 [compost metagenome]